MWYLGHRAGERRAGVAVLPTVTPSLAGLSAAGTF
jgi:hypothetical protein